MAKQANKTLIGVFVLGAVALLVAALVVFGSGKFFREANRYVYFFEGSVKGLNIGAPVMFRGVRIGKVDDFRLYYDANNEQFKIPVLVSIYEDKVYGIGVEEDLSEAEENELLQQMLEAGLRAELQMQSLVTGQLTVQLDFYPGSELKLHSLERFNLPPDVKEIPTIQSGLQQLTKKIEQIPLDQIVDDLRSTLKGINELINSPEAAKTLHYVKQTMKDARNLLRHVDEKVDPLFDQLDQTLKETQGLLKTMERQVDPLTASLKRTSDDARKLVNNVNRQVEPVKADLAKTTESLRATLMTAEEALNSINGILDNNSEFRYEISVFLRELSMAARSLRAFADYLERNPDALLRGKVTSAGEQ